jgi:alpha-methylacyl-CoA racemase
VLQGITVLDLASVGPAARASRWLADYGATVVKVGPVPADEGVQIVPPFHSYSAGRGLMRVLIDLKAAEGRDAFLRLAADADVIIESFRPGVVDRLGIGYDAVKAVNPDVVYCSTSGYGQTGPTAMWAGHDLNYLAVSGYLDCCGRDAEGAPPLPGATIADSAGGGMHAAMAILAALVNRARTRDGAFLDVSVADGVLSLMALAVDEYLATGDVPGPGHGLLTGRYACYGVYGTADGKWLSVAAIEPRFWANLCRALGLDQWVEHQHDDARQTEIRRQMATVFKTRSRDEWTKDLAPADTCVAPVLSVPEVTEDAQYLERNAFATAHRGNEPDFDQVAAVLAGMPKFDQYQARSMSETDTDVLLARVKFSKAQIAELRATGVVA